MDRSSRQEVNKETLALNDTLDQMNLMVIERTFYTKAAEYTFKCTWNILQDRSHVSPQRKFQ